MITKIIFWGEIFEMAILMDVFVLRFPETENHIFRRWSVWQSVINMTPKQVTVETRNLILYVIK